MTQSTDSWLHRLIVSGKCYDLWQSSQWEHKNNENNLGLVSGDAPGTITLVSCWQAVPSRSFQHSEKPIESRHGNITGTNTHRACPVRQLFAFHTVTCPWATGNVRCPSRIYIGWTVVHTPLTTGISSVHVYRMHYLSLLYICEVGGGVICTATRLWGGRNGFRILVKGSFPVSKHAYTLWPMQPPLQWLAVFFPEVKRPVRDGDH